MTVEQAVRLRLLAIPALTALVGQRVYMDMLPQLSTVYPAVVVQVIDDLSTYGLRGEDGTVKARVQVDAYAREASGVDTRAQVVGIAQAIHGDGKGVNATGLSGWIGVIGTPAVTVKGAFRELRRSTREGDEQRVLRMQQDYMVSYTMQ